MGFNTDIKKKIFDEETMHHLASNEELLSDISSILLILNKQEQEDKNNKIKATIKNKSGEEALISIIGVNSTSIVSSEIEGSVTFTFIKDLFRVEMLDNFKKPVPRLYLIKNDFITV